MAKTIALEKLNSVLANIKANKALEVYNQQKPDSKIGTVEENVHLAKVTLRVNFAKNEANHPFYAFVKNAGKMLIIVDLVSGTAKVVTPSTVASVTNVKGNFRINGVTYGLKDTINGQPRFRPLSYEPKKDRHKMSINGEEVTRALAEDGLDLNPDEI